MASFTACGRRIGDDWRGEYSAAPTGPVTCKRCAATLPTAPPADALAVYGAHVTYPDPDRDTFTVWGDDGTLLGTVDSTRDHTGDVHATRASGETVAPRFTDHADAVAYLLGGERSELCARAGADTTGGCIRAAGHRLHCQDSRGDRWDPAVRWDHGSVRIFPSYGLASDTGTSSDGIGWSRWSLVNGMYVRPDSAEAPEDSEVYGASPYAIGDRVVCASPGMTDDGRHGTVTRQGGDEYTVRVRFDGDAIDWQWHHTNFRAEVTTDTTGAAWDAWKARGQAVGRARLALSLAQSYRVNGAPHRARVHLSTAAAARGQAASASRILSALGGVTQ